MKKIYQRYHDDSPCKEKLVYYEGGWFCPKCKLYPDSQSMIMKEIKNFSK